MFKLLLVCYLCHYFFCCLCCPLSVTPAHHFICLLFFRRFSPNNRGFNLWWPILPQCFSV